MVFSEFCFLRHGAKKKPSALECSKSSSFALEMKSTKFAVGGDEAKIAAFGDALADSVLDEADAEEQDDGGHDECDDGKPNGDDDSSEMEGAEASFEAKYEAVLQLIFGSFKPIARSRSTKEDGDDFDEEYWSKMPTRLWALESQRAHK